VPRLFGIERPRLEAVRMIDMSASNAWAELAATYCRTQAPHQEHDGAKSDLKKLSQRTPGRPQDTACGPSGQIGGHKFRAPERWPMQRSSDTIGAFAAALAKAQGDLRNPERALTATFRSPFPTGSRSDLPLRLARQRTRYRPRQLVLSAARALRRPSSLICPTTNRACQLHTTGFDMFERPIISVVPQPSAVAK
jgi:hypothetical protein